MKAVRLHAAKDIRVDDVPQPAAPQNGEVLIRVRAVGICGSDLHMYEDGHIGGMPHEHPMILGHEFMGEIVALGDNTLDGNQQPLEVGQRVAVDPASPCYHCEMCEQGHPNLCPNHTFYGAYPTDGALQPQMIVNARNCFPISDNISDGAGTLLETLGIAIHAVDLGKIKVGNSVAIIGCGPVGLLLIQMAKLAGADPIYAFDKFSWRVDKACQLGATAWDVNAIDPLDQIMTLTKGRGIDVVFEAAWADTTVQLAADLAVHGGRVVLVGIPGDDRILMTHSVVRRKGLTIKMSRRMKHTYPRAIHLTESGMVDLEGLISHHFPLEQTVSAFKMNAAYAEGIHKIIIDI